MALQPESAAPPQGISILGFQFSYRSNLFDWRLLHGIDVDAVVRLTDVKAIEDCLDTLQHGSLDSEKGLSSKNCIQLFRLLQLAVEYLWHLRNAHTTLLGFYQEAIFAAERWKMAARTYLDTGNSFIAGCMHSGDISRTALEAVDVARHALEEQDNRYNDALDKLEDEDQRARYFHFRKQRTELLWHLIHSVDLDELLGNTRVAALDGVMHNLVFSSIVSEDREELTPHHFAHLVPLAQCALDYMLFQANATGAALEQAMARLQGSCTEIPVLTTGTQDLHTRITTFILEAQQHAAQLGLAVAGANPQDAAAAAMAGGWPQGVQGPALQARPASAWASRPGSALSGGPYRPLGGMAAYGMNLPVPGAPGPMGSALDEAIALAQAGAMGPAAEMHSRAADLQYKVESLEADLRVERTKTDEMRRLMSDIKDRLNQPQGLEPYTSMPIALPTMPGSGQLGMGMGMMGMGMPGQMGMQQWGAGGVVGYNGPMQQGLRDMHSRSEAGVATGTQASSSPTRLKLYINEDVIRVEERQKAMDVLQTQVESLKQQAMRQFSERRVPSRRERAKTPPNGLHGGFGERSAPNLRGMGGKEVGDLADLLPPAPSRALKESPPQLPAMSAAQGGLQPPLAAGLPPPAPKSKPMSVAERQLEAMGFKKGAAGVGEKAGHRRSQSSASGRRRAQAAVPVGAVSDLE